MPKDDKKNKTKAQESQLKKASSSNNSVKSNAKDPQASDKKQKQRFYYDPIIEAKQPASSKASVKKDSQAKKKLPDEIILGLKLEKVGKEIQEEQARRKKAGEKSKSNLQLLIEKMEEEILAEEK